MIGDPRPPAPPEPAKLSLVEKLRRVAKCVYLAAEEGPARDIAETCIAAASQLTALQQERDEARNIVAKVNNEVHGSDGYFTEPSCVTAVQDLKLLANQRYAELIALQQEHATLKAEYNALYAKALTFERFRMEDAHDHMQGQVLAAETRKRLEAELTTLRADQARLTEALTKAADSIERMALRMDKDGGNQTAIALWLHLVEECRAARPSDPSPGSPQDAS